MSDERPAQPGELCTCGHPAVVVYSNERFGEVGYCGAPGSARIAVSPCPFCGARFPHKTSWGDPERCPDYQLIPPAVWRDGVADSTGE